MAYLIKRLNSDGSESYLVDSGMTRQQVRTALINHQLLGYFEKLPALPKFGKKLIMAHASPRISYTISHL